MSENREDPREDPINAQDSDWEDAGLPALEDSTEDTVLPGERPIAMNEFGTTGTEREAGEPLDTALAREEPDVWNRHGLDPKGGVDADPAAGRLTAEDDGGDSSDLIAEEDGADGGGYSAEEEAVRVEGEPREL
ncbi:DUF5709 domain-containing protein [Nocardiopsis ansamitocini]|uniref:DUF5709 domain-containing protein n=1 Tax=Nocardiopsis ansamitocini TaxID=1670832 RepID=A0A9W6P6R7_9ACTN|nr:DUF5709 domain-containing protein [Nocardiopsis ansamitocini]GLU48073.1 hypothetical protein Nans01_24240 [Nocardiopsis ansamitocini]